MRMTISAALFVLAGQPVWAACDGQNLFDTMPPDRAAAIEAATEGVPYRRGLLFEARRDDQRIILAGTYHFADSRHQAMVDRLRPLIAEADALFVEAGPEEEARLAEALTRDPTLMVNPDGPTLPERLSAPEWQALAQAMSDRGTPAVIAAKMRPWYVAMMLGVSPCMVRTMAETGDAGGLDHLLVAEAEAAGTPIRPLEPWDTIFGLFEGLTPQQELDMIRAGLPAAGYADDYAVTLTDAYFDGDVWKIWEFGRFDAIANSGLSRAEVDRQMSFAQTRLMDDRNRAWIAPLTRGAVEAASEGQGIVAAFGALHLPGAAGVLALLEAEGFDINRLD
ncbi:TraB/GumN family protein [Paracoccus liaowanqingii]|uniref:TraB/GumN family protein n=1 Tax=Paracoccus liaowanqingii TaxID=2560053 RepID=A0A4P7HKL0_9RHOB|nr:TraB/GumN family protein [Paracoccus liaowanqingii]QBX34163.1 TraB/GumN family protein [Paracoccus liaowanqingii]